VRRNFLISTLGQYYRVIKLRRMRREEKSIVSISRSEELKRKRPIERPRDTWDSNIKMFLKK
jgi:hypothetical protein